MGECEWSSTPAAFALQKLGPSRFVSFLLILPNTKNQLGSSHFGTEHESGLVARYRWRIGNVDAKKKTPSDTGQRQARYDRTLRQ